ncbi:uncharacterized protein J4E84_004975 [Alternaria hordeiaustralica]|uniref:uncharacterized protein n=1 Tax=Alternaria hordeiaustralica TaxID=1187925 RepID=UPI0020C4CCC5|nr:uncharacterized protein J4E84_004975 [Alternaria hordeiaustralica]KAI4688047.1 hypothetical protein J4E84_004975 [Alternaria hordeiaustralica]
MEYPDDLDLEGMSALDELTGDAAPFDHTAAPKLSSELEDLIRATKCQTPANGTPKRKSSKMDYLFKITAPITPTILASAAILATQPKIHQGQGEDGDALFCQIRDIDIPTIKKWLAEAYPTISPTFIPINIARKTLSPFSAYPTLGYDTTLPHHRPQNTTDSEYLPAQNQFPVWYFFYGTLANPSHLAHLFNSPPGHQHTLLPAMIHSGKIRTWGGKYKALVDNPGTCVEGCAYEVVSKEQEDALRVYETAKYEVVRVEIMCRMDFRARFVRGLTFRFAGEEGELDEVEGESESDEDEVEAAPVD